MNHKIIIIIICLVSTFSISSNKANASTLAIEADAAAYFLNGYSFILRNTFDNGINIALGTGLYELPKFVVEADQDNFSTMKWKAKSKSIQVARFGYRFSKAYSDGFVLDFIALNQSWKVTSETLNASTEFKTLSLGLSTGYYYHIGKSFYIYPTASYTKNSVLSGNTTVQGNNYKVKDTSFNYSAHIGYEF